MFARIKEFLTRHKKKFIFSGVLIGGVVLAGKYAEHRFMQWQEKETNILLEKQKRRLHFQSTKKTASTTIISLTTNLKDIILKEVDTDYLLLALKENPKDKIEVWGQLKIKVFTRTVTMLYASSVLSAAIHVQLMLLGAYVYGDLIKEAHAGVIISQDLQRKYLSCVEYFITKGIYSLIQKIEACVHHTISGLSLGRCLTLQQLEGIFQEILLGLNGESNLHEVTVNENLKLSEWSQYVLKDPLTMCMEEVTSPSKQVISDEQVLKNMIIETADIIDASDFSNVIKCLVQQGLNNVLDHVANYYMPLKSNNDDDDDDSSMDDSTEQNLDLLAINTELPVAKIIPILSPMINELLSSKANQLSQKLLLDNKLEELSYNIYEGFLLPLGN